MPALFLAIWNSCALWDREFLHDQPPVKVLYTESPVSLLVWSFEVHCYVLSQAPWKRVPSFLQISQRMPSASFVLYPFAVKLELWEGLYAVICPGESLNLGGCGGRDTLSLTFLTSSSIPFPLPQLHWSLGCYSDIPVLTCRADFLFEIFSLNLCSDLTLSSFLSWKIILFSINLPDHTIIITHSATLYIAFFLPYFSPQNPFLSTIMLVLIIFVICLPPPKNVSSIKLEIFVQSVHCCWTPRLPAPTA